MLAPTLLAVLTIAPRPLMRDFMGMNTHTVQFRTELYHPVTRLLRNYHPVGWDLGDSPENHPKMPVTTNGVDWRTLYPVWKQKGFLTSACLMFEDLAAEKWKQPEEDAFAYGLAFGRALGRSEDLDSVEIGNEPGLFEDALYTKIFRGMAEGVRRAAPRLKISTCAVRVEKSERYHKNVECVRGLEKLYDALSIHVYAQVEPWPSFKRTHPEDPKAPFLEPVQKLMAWRDQYAPGKKIWVTEFGWDAASRPADPKGDNPKWVGNTELQQAQWLVRGYLELARLGADRAYMFWFNDEDSPSIHGASGLTRKYQPKPSYWATAQLLRTLGDYRYERDVLREANAAHAMEFRTAAGKRMIVAWVPTEEGKSREMTLPIASKEIERAERMVTADGSATAVTVQGKGERSTIKIDGSPVYLYLK